MGQALCTAAGGLHNSRTCSAGADALDSQQVSHPVWLCCHAIAHSDTEVGLAQVYYSAIHLRRAHLGCKQPAIMGSLNLIDSCKASLAQEPAGSKGSSLDGCCRMARPCTSAAHLRFRNRRGGSLPADAASITSGQACSVKQCRSQLCQRGVPDRHHAVLTTICRLHLGSDASLLLLFAIPVMATSKMAAGHPLGVCHQVYCLTGMLRSKGSPLTANKY